MDADERRLKPSDEGRRKSLLQAVRGTPRPGEDLPDSDRGRKRVPVLGFADTCVVFLK